MQQNGVNFEDANYKLGFHIISKKKLKNSERKAVLFPTSLPSYKLLCNADVSFLIATIFTLFCFPFATFQHTLLSNIFNHFAL